LATETHQILTLPMDFQFPVAPKAFQIMLKPVGPLCNLNCTYCYYLEKKNLFPGKTQYRLDEELLELYIRDYIASQQVPVVSFVWQGGEPSILGVEYYRKAVELQKKYAGDRHIENSFQTNGTFLTDEFCTFFKENEFLIGLSIDGPEHLHDFYRVDNQGKPTWKKVMQGVELLKKHGVEFNTLSVVNCKTAQEPLAVYNFLKKIGSTFIQFIPIVERKVKDGGHSNQELVHHHYKGEAEVTEWSVSAKDYGKFMCTIFDEWVRKDVGRHYVQLFDVTLANWVGAMPGLCVFSETCGTAAVMEHNGDVYSCDHFVYDEFLLGNINEQSLTELMGSTRQAIFGQDKKTRLPAYCKACPVRFACHGDCPKHRFIKTPQGDPGLSYLCEGYKMFFAHVRPYMDFMATELKAQRAPANVMEWIRRKEVAQIPRQTKVGRNDPCPCGSGKKFKQCHGK
jgi:uncharacterized protein